ncbi:pseudouridine synthase [Xylariales sp. AK1849]|nr:pseudouridine synthase [Xylariales sp. AK1849]
MATHTAMTQGNDPEVRSEFERSVGILHIVSPKQHGWSGVTRMRFTDFQVHEITEDGEVLRLSDYSIRGSDYDRKEAAKKADPQTKQPKSPRKPHDEANTSLSLVAAKSAARNATEASDAKEPGMTDQAKSCSDQTTTKTTDAVNTADTGDAKVSDDRFREAKADTIPDGSIPESDSTILKELLNEVTAAELVALYGKICDKPKDVKGHDSVKLPHIVEKPTRTRIHSELRRIFLGKINTETDKEGIIHASMTSGRQKWGNRSDNRMRQNTQKGPHLSRGSVLQFNLYKENKDTMEAISHLSRVLKMKPHFFRTAGTKDRRAATTQRVSIVARDPKKMLHANEKIYGVKIGDFKFTENHLYLGCHGGNEFTIVMKDCTFQGTENESFARQLEIAQSTVDQAVASIARNGFINYFGTQRFGTHAIGTQSVGMKILKSDFKGVVQDLLSFDSAIVKVDTSTTHVGEFVPYDDINRAKVLAKYEETGNAEEARDSLPRRYRTEFAILNHLSKSPNDYCGALMAIEKSMRTLYLHAYQSLVWNLVASKRWESHGASVIKGDLVLATIKNTIAPETKDIEVDDEENIHLGRANHEGDEPHQSVRVLTAEDVESGQYSISDVVLPTPGTDVVYPNNEIAKNYTEVMAKEQNGALDPHDMKRPQRHFSLRGTYRKYMGSFITAPTGSVCLYTHNDEQLVPTDVDLIKSRLAKEHEERAVASREKNEKSSKWHAFAGNVQENERKQAQENVAAAKRRKAENPHDAADARLNDTWVQTSVDGSKKRVKVAEHSSEAGCEDRACPNVDAMDVDEPAVGAEETPLTGASLSEEPKRNEPIDNSLPKSSGAPASPTTETTTVRYRGVEFKASTPSEADEKVMAPNAQATSEIPEKQVSSEGLDQELIVSPPSDISVPEVPSKTEKLVPSSEDMDTSLAQDTMRAPSKIAVIFKFSLDTSVYATIVLRELQG